MKYWQSKFGQVTLNRALEYAEKGRVRILNSSDNRIEAVVRGRDDYNVFINLNDNEIGSMYCSCPYFLREGNCKHIAAALYSSQDFKRDDVSKIVSSAEMQDITDFLIRALSENKDLYNDFKVFTTHEIDNDYFENKLCESFASAFDVLKFIDTDLEVLIGEGEYELLFKLSRLIIRYAEEISREGQYNASYLICEKINAIAVRLIEVSQTKEFLASVILSSHDEGICYLFVDTYSQIGDIDELFK